MRAVAGPGAAPRVGSRWASRIADWRDVVERIVTGLDLANRANRAIRWLSKLEALDFSLYADRSEPIDAVIGRERTRRSQVVKQADVVALLALLPEEFPGSALVINFRHYEPRCAHGSSLSAAIDAVVAARLGETETALRFLRHAAAADLELDPAAVPAAYGSPGLGLVAGHRYSASPASVWTAT